MLARLRGQSYESAGSGAGLVDAAALLDEDAPPAVPDDRPAPVPARSEVIVTSQVRIARDLEALRAEIAELRTRVRAFERGVA